MSARGRHAPHALVLAAGRGRRFGGEKLLAPYQGRPLLAHVLELVAEGQGRGIFESSRVVLAADDQAAGALCRERGLTAVPNRDPGLGLSHSLRLGLQALEDLASNGESPVLVFLGDQPLVRLDVVEKVIAAYRSSGAMVVRPRYETHPDVPGHPTLLDRSIWALASEVQGDRGLAGLLASGSIDIVTVDVAGANPDVDTLADLQALEEASQ